MTLEQLRRQKIAIIVGSLVVLFIFFAFISHLFIKPRPKKVTLTIWGFDGPSVMQEIFTLYKASHPNVEFKYTQKTFEGYQKSLLDAMASGNSPDIFLIHNGWLQNYKNKIQPYFNKNLKPQNITDAFADIVYQDFVSDGKLWALPSYIDTLALYYNADIFNRNNIALPPTTWQEFKETAKKLTFINEKNEQIIVSGAAVGSAKNINRAPDLFSLVLLQKGFNKENPTKNLFSALDFYTSFANPYSENYIWDKSFHYSIDAFSEGNVAMMFNYHYQQELLKTKNPYLNFKITKVPQFNKDKPVNFANYWAWTVSIFSNDPFQAWDFIISLTTNSSLAEKYLQLTNQPPALRVLINKYLTDPDLGIFCSQALTAKDIKTKDPQDFEDTFTKTIESFLNGTITLKEVANILSTKL